MQDTLINKINEGCQQLFGIKPDRLELTRPEEQFGDYSTNVALQLAKKLDQNPRQIAETLGNYLKENISYVISDIQVAGPGFINLTLTSASLLELLKLKPKKTNQGQEVVIEYSDPNPFKVLHVGHAYTTIVGDAIANILELSGANVHRVNYGGDVGLHVAKTIKHIISQFGGENPEKLNEITENYRAGWLSASYVSGNEAYENGDEAFKDEVRQLNKKIYELHTDNDHESNLAIIYWTCREWSYQAFDEFYARLGTKMERYYPESSVADTGLEIVKQHIGDVFQESEGAVIYEGEAEGLHTRVFINKQGLPTYEAKEVGLIVKKNDDYHYDQSIIITANEQAQYMAVVFSAMSKFMPELTQKSKYISHGMVKLIGGTKMSSRKGNIIRADEVIDMTAKANKQLIGHEDMRTTLGAIKYSFLKSRLGGDLVYDPKESLSLEGNSGPYLQYAHARACSILAKAPDSKSEPTGELDQHERSLALKLSQYSETIDKSLNDLLPHHLCTYLYELAQVFNRFYENSHVLGDPRQDLRLYLLKKYKTILKDGLELLGIEAPDKL